MVQWYKYITDSSDLLEVAQSIAPAEVIGIDTETTSFSPHQGKMRLFQVNTGKNIYVVDLFKAGGLGPIEKVLREYKGIVVGQNAKYDQTFLLHEYGIELDRIFDTMLASGVIAAGAKGTSHALDSIIPRFLGMQIDKELQVSDWSRNELSEEQLSYAANDVRHLLKLREIMIEKIKERGLVSTTRIEFNAMLPVAAMELKGLKLDVPKWKILIKEQEKKYVEQEREIQEILKGAAGRMQEFLPLDDFDGAGGVNLRSPKQLIDVLHKFGEKNGIQELCYLHSTDEAILKLAEDCHPIVNKILEYRKTAKAISSYGEDYLGHINPVTGRIHASYFPISMSGRYRVSKPNTAQLPRDKRYRACFVPEEGNVFVMADFSQLEVRLMAELADEKNMLKVFQEDGDIHTKTAKEVLGSKTVTKEERQKAKCLIFGLLYGMGAEKLAKYAKMEYGVEMSLNEAEKYRSRFFELYSDLYEWQIKTVQEGQKRGWSRTLGGRLRIIDRDKYSEYLNFPDQGSAADGLKVALRILYDSLRGKKAWAVHMVHDEIIVECEKDIAEEVKEILERSMISGMSSFVSNVRIKVEGSIGSSWAEKK